MKLAVFDFDSTLMDGETIDFFAEELGFKDEVVAITERAMAGELDFYASLVERVALL
jgi:phosphoserine phosphatase